LGSPRWHVSCRLWAMVMTSVAAGMECRALPGTLLEMTYQNDSGEVSRRRVRVVRWMRGRNGFSYLRGWCFLRGEERTFRADRILDWHLEKPREAAAEVRTAEWTNGMWRPTWPAREPQPEAAAPIVPVPAALAPVPARPSRGGRGFFAFIGVGAVVFIIRAITSTGTQPAPAPAPRYVPAPPPKAVVVPAPKPASRPAPKPVQRDEAAAAVRSGAFRQATAMADNHLEAFYEKADSNADGRLDWAELSSFQSRLDRSCRYLSNERALWPDEFLARGGGDCEDWALFTCGLLRYWGWDAWVGSLAPSEHGDGHAVCMVRLAQKPSRYAWWHVDEDGSLGRFPARAGWYVPVDYGHVGELSDAVGDGWKLQALWKPESIYGERM
jgi:hypothetical protein